MPAGRSEEGLKRCIGVPDLTLSIICGVVGAGIFALPAIVGTSLGAFAVYAYIFCGVLFASILLCYAEMGSRVTRSGGSYAYVEAAFGGFAGYIVNWMYFFGWSIIGSAALMNIIADSLSVLFPVLAGPLARAALFFILIGFMIVVNVFGAREGIAAVKLITIIKLLPLAGIILLGFGHVSRANLHWHQLPALKTFASAVLILFFAFAGFETSLGASGEIKNSRRTVPMSIIIAGIVVLVLYMLLQTVTQGILGPQMPLYKNAPLAAVADRIIGPTGATILLLCAAFSCFGNVMLDILCTPRSLFAAANEGYFPPYLGRVHPKFATPHLAVITYGSLIFFLALTGGFQQLAIMASAIVLLIYLAVILAMVKLRAKEPGRTPGVYRAPGGFVTPLVGVAAIVWLFSSLGKWEIFSTLIFIAVVCVLYGITRWLRAYRRAPRPAG